MQGGGTPAGRLAGRLSGLYRDSGVAGEVLIDRLACCFGRTNETRQEAGSLSPAILLDRPATTRAGTSTKPFIDTAGADVQQAPKNSGTADEPPTGD